MKNLVSKALSLVCICAIFSLSVLWTPANGATNYSVQQDLHLQSNAGTYSWSAHASAVSYQVVLTPRASGGPIVFNTTNTFISLAGVPSGTYDVTVYAIGTKGSSTIIVEDLIAV